MSTLTHATKPQPPSYADLEKNRSKLMWQAQRIVRNSATAEDLVQDCLIKAWLNLDKFRGESQVYSWLYRILLNTVFNDLQRHRHEVLASSLTRESEADGALEIPDIATPEEHLIARQRAQALLSRLESLSPSLTDTLQLRYQDDLSYAEIAQSLHVPINTVRTRLHRAHQALGIK
ncbi:sigma-70 family RNA polymerase sigma factor [Thiobacillus denitrificans]|uniref:sigma-70 family RNA polymerase sigma factor n=1 Tax=Thiobacillus denitrificans TaxID=36861 RepID=UPI0009E68ED2|nr:sigma-70 family RNA polymerase sigma factor [Thiobacillus denitrificans]